MMLETHDRLGNPQQIECSRVLVRDVYNNPLMVCIEHAPGQYWMKHLNDPGFNESLQSMGINQTVITSTLPATPTPSPNQLSLPFQS